MDEADQDKTEQKTDSESAECTTAGHCSKPAERSQTHLHELFTRRLHALQQLGRLRSLAVIILGCCCADSTALLHWPAVNADPRGMMIQAPCTRLGQAC